MCLHEHIWPAGKTRYTVKDTRSVKKPIHGDNGIS